MATKFIKGAREGMTQRILRDAFSSKFDELATRVRAEWVRALATEHPVWLALRADPAASAYVACHHTRPLVEIGGVTTQLRRSTFLGRLPEYHKYYISGPALSLQALLISPEPAPPRWDYVVGQDARDEYVKLWEGYNCAYATLIETFKRYQSHEALVKDFPEYVAYLPAEPVAVPMQAVAQVRSRLSSLGVPKEEQ